MSEKELRNNVYLLRKQRGIKQEVLAAEIGVNRVAISGWERQTRQPTKANARKLADYFGVSTLVVLGEAPVADMAPESVDEQNKELWELRELARRDPGRKALFKLARYGSDQDVKQMVALIDAMRATNPDFYDGDDPS